MLAEGIERLANVIRALQNEHAGDEQDRAGVVELMPPFVARQELQLDDLVAWSTARNPDDRPRDAREMLDHMAGMYTVDEDGEMSQARRWSSDKHPGTKVQYPIYSVSNLGRSPAGVWITPRAPKKHSVIYWSDGA